jgi:hypothetical protein
MLGSCRVAGKQDQCCPIKKQPDIGLLKLFAKRTFVRYKKNDSKLDRVQVRSRWIAEK